MPSQKTAAEIQAEVVTNVEASLALVGSVPDKSYTRAIGASVGAFGALLYKYSNYLLRQMFVRTALNSPVDLNGEVVIPLEEHGVSRGVGRPVAATNAEIQIQVDVITQGGNILAGDAFTYEPTGYVYQAKASVSLDAATKLVDLVATGDPQNLGGVGAAGNIPVGETVKFVTSRLDVQTDASVTQQLVTAADREGGPEYRTRVQNRRQRPPQGGSLADYRDWATEVNGIVAAYPYTGEPGEMVVYVRATAASSGDPDGVPTAAQITAVETSIGFDSAGVANRKPRGVALDVRSVLFEDYDITIRGLEVDNVASVKTQISDAITTTLENHESFIRGLSTYRRDRVSRSDLENAVHRVVQANGGTISEVIVSISLPSTLVVESQIPSGPGDAVWAVNKVSPFNTTRQQDIELCRQAGADAAVALFFASVAIPAGAVITAATLRVMAGASGSSVKAGIDVRAVDSVTPALETGATDTVTLGEALTAAAGTWVPDWWLDGVAYTSVDISPVIQELVDRGDWAGSHDIKLVLDDAGDLEFRTLTDPSVSTPVNPLLHIEYASPTPSTIPVYVRQLPPGTLARRGTVLYV